MNEEPKPTTRWKRRKLVQGVQRYCMVLRISHNMGGDPCIEYRYEKPLFTDNSPVGRYIGQGHGQLPPRVTTSYASLKRFHQMFEEAK